MRSKQSVSRHGPRRISHHISTWGRSRFAGRDIIRPKVIKLEGETSIHYLSSGQLVMLNKRVLEEIKAKKGDKHEVLSFARIEGVLEETKSQQGDTYDKAVTLIIELTKRHAFGSGNRRTAYAAAKAFLESNGEEFHAEMNPKAMQGIREGFYSKEEIKEWLKGNGIREFNRFASKEEWKG